MSNNEDKKNDTFTLPEGRVINHSLFVKDQYNDKSTPAYKVEIAIDADSDAYYELEDRLLAFADDKWGKGAGDDPDLILPFIDGDRLANKREKKGKDGSAYAGKIVIRANTIYNKDGQDGPGGVQVYDQDVEEVSPARSSEVYRGCYGEAAVNIGTYEDDDGNNAIKFYLAAFQKTKEGERLTSSADKSGLFKARGRSEGGSAGRRQRRTRD
jgi:hypothetical protein